MSPVAITPDTVVETISDIRTARIPIIPAVDSTTMTCLSPLPSRSPSLSHNSRESLTRP